VMPLTAGVHGGGGCAARACWGHAAAQEPAARRCWVYRWRAVPSVGAGADMYSSCCIDLEFVCVCVCVCVCVDASISAVVVTSSMRCWPAMALSACPGCASVSTAAAWRVKGVGGGTARADGGRRQLKHCCPGLLAWCRARFCCYGAELQQTQCVCDRQRLVKGVHTWCLTCARRLSAAAPQTCY
jgi:hypothetical protein